MPESAPCPTCRKMTKWEGNPFRPFCSERCKVKDLGAWASEDYRIAGPEADEGDEESEAALPNSDDREDD